LFWLFLSAVAEQIFQEVLQTILQLKTPDEMRGRVSSVNSMFVGSSNKLGAFESGLAAKLIGPVVAIGIANPVLLDLDLTKEIEENEKEA
jgi:hypothetical protein